MDQDYPKFIAHRNNFDRRSGTESVLPYMTDEGMVLIDRREAPDRRTGSQQAVPPAISVRQ